MISINNQWIPKECVEEIISHLDSSEDVMQMSLVSKSFKTCAEVNYIWDAIILRECPKRMIQLYPRIEEEVTKKNFIRINRAIIDGVIQNEKKEVHIGHGNMRLIFSDSLISSVKSTEIFLLKKVRLIRDELDAGPLPVLHEMKALLYDGIDINGVNNLEGLKVILEAGANPNIWNSRHYTVAGVVCKDFPTPLMATAHYGLVEGAQLLLESGADPAIKDEEGQTALDLLHSSGSVPSRYHPEDKKTLEELLNQYSAKGSS